MPPPAKKIALWLPPSICAAVIFVTSSIPGSNLPRMRLLFLGHDIFPSWLAEHPDKLAHGLIYALLGWLCLRAFAGDGRFSPSKTVFLAFLAAAAYGAADEWHQALVPQRSCDLGDWLADCIGAGLTIAGLRRHYCRAPERTASRGSI